MPALSWRRLHGDHIVAEVVPEPGPDEQWRAAVWNSDSVERIFMGKRFSRFLSAQAAADHEARLRFKHRCDVSTLGGDPIGREGQVVSAR